MTSSTHRTLTSKTLDLKAVPTSTPLPVWHIPLSQVMDINGNALRGGGSVTIVIGILRLEKMGEDATWGRAIGREVVLHGEGTYSTGFITEVEQPPISEPEQYIQLTIEKTGIFAGERQRPELAVDFSMDEDQVGHFEKQEIHMPAEVDEDTDGVDIEDELE